MNRQVAVFGAGCFWCVDAIFSELKGMISVSPGYAGGHKKDPTYEEVCSGTTGHVEVCRIVFDPDVISYDKLLEVFWQVHDPTTPNRQGHDVGEQYRSVIFYTGEEQKIKALKYKKKLNESGVWPKEVVTSVEPFAKFYPAEDYHNDYFRNNPSQPYCRMVIAPKMAGFRKVFSGISTDETK
ncbi:MAG: peptide-methionine (S)-S-oxide reductase MsrA [Flavobacteriales bacterium]